MTSPERNPAEQDRGVKSPAGAGTIARNPIPFSASLRAAELPRSSSRYALAGPDHIPPLGGRGNSHGPAVSTAGLTCAASVAFGRAGGVFLNFDVSASPCLAADDAAHDVADAFPSVGLAHAHKGRSKHGREIQQVVSGLAQNVRSH